MKKRGIRGAAFVLAALLLVGCGQKNNEKQESTQEDQAKSTIYLSQLDVTDMVELGEYKGIEVEGQDTNVPQSMVDSYLEYALSLQSELVPVTDRDTVEDGDTVTIDYEGKKNGVAFDGGTATDYNLEIGSGLFIDGFETGLIGVKKGETVELNLSFPENYPAEDLAGQPVVFTVTVKEIQSSQAPTLDDAYVVSLGIEGVSTVEEYRRQVHEILTKQVEEEYEYQLQVSLVEKIMEGSKIQDPSEELQQKYADVALRQTEKAAEYYGIDLETYVSTNYRIGLEEYQTQINEGAYEAAKQAMLCKKIADVEGIEVTDQELEEAAKENYATYGFSNVEDFKASNDMEEYRDSMLLNKVLSFLVDNATIIKPAQGAEEIVEEAKEAVLTEETAAEATEAE